MRWRRKPTRSVTDRIHTLTPTSRHHSPTPRASAEPRPSKPPSLTCQAGRAHKVPRGDRGSSCAAVPGRGRTLARDLGGDTIPALADSHQGALESLPGLSCHSCGVEQVARLIRADPAPTSQPAGARVSALRTEPGINCRAPGCRPPGALSGSDRKPDPRGRHHPPLSAHSRARAGRLRLRLWLRAPGSRLSPAETRSCLEAGGCRSP